MSDNASPMDPAFPAQLVHRFFTDAKNRESTSSSMFGYLMDIKGVQKAVSLEEVVEVLYPDKYHEHIVRQAKRGVPLARDVMQGIHTESQLRVFSDAVLGWDLLYSLFRESILTAAPHRLPARLKELNILLATAPDITVKVFVYYLLILLHYRQSKGEESNAAKQDELTAALEAANSLYDAAMLAGSRVSPLFKDLALVNQVAFRWDLMILDSCQPESHEFLELIKFGQKVCRAAAENHPYWTRMRRDESEYTALRAIFDNFDDQLPRLDAVIFLHVEAFPNATLNQVLHRLHENQEPIALEKIQSRPIHKHLEELSHKANSRVSGKLLKQLKENFLS